MARTLAESLGGRLTTLGTMVAAHRGLLLLVGVVLVLGLGSLALWVHRSVEGSSKRQLRAQLTVTLEAAVGGLVAELETAQRSAQAASQSPELAQALRSCLSDREACRQQPARRFAIEERLRPQLALGRFTHARVLDSEGQLVLDFPDTGGPSELPALRPLVRAPRLILPTLPGAEACLFVTVFDADQPIAGLLLSFPMSAPTRVLRVARAGTSGETYAFDARGRLLSESRFTDELRELGLLAPERGSAVLALALRDPGGDLTRGFVASTSRERQPLTRMVASVLAKQRAVDVDGYRDYRGVQVIGAGRWLPQLGIGVVSEVDAEEAFRGPAELDRLFVWLVLALVVMAALVLGAGVLSTQLSQRASHAEHAAAKFGQYVLTRKLGEGGMGSVYLATHALLRRPAAIKLLRPERITPDSLSRFEREVLITSRLSHPNTVAIYDHGRTENGSIYYVMEYLDGLDLQRLVETFGPLPAARVIHLLRQLCGSLSEAHAMGLVHRDIKPANLMVCTRGGIADTLKVVDFGVVKSSRLNQVGLTASKLLLGTPMYMAPEMFDSAEQASAQSDLYALGAVSYFLLTGETVFDAESTNELCMAHLTKTPEPLSERLPELDQALDMVVQLCLAKRRDARPSSAAAVLDMLERSPLAHRWTSADAEAWWLAQAAKVAELRADGEAALSPVSRGQRTIRPVP